MEKNRTKLAGRVFLITIISYLLMVLGMARLLFVANMYGYSFFVVMVVVLVLGPVIIATPSIIVIIKYKLYTDFLGFLKFNIRDLFLGAIVMALIYPLIAALKSTTTLIFGDISDSAGIFLQGISSLPMSYLPFFIFTIAFLPAVLEEIQFRGLFAGLYKRAGYFKAAIMSSLLFGLIHMNIVQFVYAFAIGMVLYYIRVASGSLYVTMILHFLFNALSVVLVFMLPQRQANFEDYISSQQLLILYVIGIIGLILALIILRLMAKLNKNYDLLNNFFKSGSQKIFSLPLLIGIIITIISIIVSLGK